MKLLISGCTRTTKRLMAERPERIGVLITPSNGNREWWGDDTEWSCDNDCFNGLNAPAYLRMLAKISAFRSRPRWVSCPDTVGDADDTLRQFAIWQPMLAELNLPVALVAQDGLQADAVPWGKIACLFIGGSTDWKLSDHAAAISFEAHQRGKLVHYGRVNTLVRIEYIARRMRDREAWCDTIDGTGFSAYGDKRIPAGIRWLDSSLSDAQMVMFGGNA